MKKVALFGGSFDPVHLKHYMIVEELLENFDEVWIIVAKSSPFKNKHFTSFSNRFKMCKIAFSNLNVKVLDIEEKYGFKYTYDTVKFLKEKYDASFYFAIGSDNEKDLDRWYKYEELKKLIEFVVFKRTTISSTISRITKDTGIDLVNQYIKSNNLYQNEFESDFLKLREVVSENRYNHTIYVYTLILELATIHNLDIKKCALSAIYHDFYKELANKEYIEKYKISYPKYKNFNNKVMHAIIAGEMLDLDEEVLDAIKYHTLGKENAGVILKALYIADYCERSRKCFDEVKYILDIAYINLDEAYIEAFTRQRDAAIKKYGRNEDVEKFIRGETI